MLVSIWEKNRNIMEVDLEGMAFEWIARRGDMEMWQEIIASCSILVTFPKDSICSRIGNYGMGQRKRKEKRK